jgi:hypothetical protein
VEEVDAITEDPRFCLFLDTEPQARMQASKSLFKLLPGLVFHKWNLTRFRIVARFSACQRGVPGELRVLLPI